MENDVVLITPKDVARDYPIAPASVWRRMKDGTFTARQVGKKWFIEKASVDRAFYGEKAAWVVKVLTADAVFYGGRYDSALWIH